MDRLAREVEAEREAVERAHLELVYPLFLARLEKNALVKREAGLNERVKQYLQLEEPGTQLRDEELGVYAYLQETSTGVRWDLRSLTDAQALALRDAGCLDIKTALFTRLRADSPSITWDDIWNNPGMRLESRTQSLQVKVIEKEAA